VPGFLALVPWIVGALTAAVGVASYTAAKKAQKAAKRPNDEQRGVLVNKESNVEQIPVIYGERRVGGVRVFVSTDGTYKTVGGEKQWYSGYHPETEVYDDVTGTPTNQYLYIALVLAEGEVESITDIYVDDLPITDAKYSGLVDYNVYLGTDDQTMPDSHYLREANEFWTADHRLRGVAFLGLRFTWDEEAFSGIPDVTALVKGKKVYDPRTATTAWSDNPALCIRDYLTNTRYGKGIPTSAIDDDAIEAAADDCDESVTLYDGGGSGKLFTCNAVLDTSKSLFDNLNILLLGCRGFLPYSQGQYRLKIDGSRSSEFTFTNNEIIDGIVITGESKDEKLNRVSVKFPNPDANWQPDTAIWPPAGSTEETTFLAEDSGVLLQEDIDLDTITNYYQARDLARVLVLRSRNALTCSIKTTSEALQLEIADVISITHSTPGWVAKPFQVTQMQLNEDGTVSLNLLEYDSTIYTWEEGTEQTAYPDTNLPDPFTVGVVSNITVTETTTLGSDGTVIPTGLIEWDTSYDRLVNQYEIQYKLTSEADTEFKSIFTSVPKYEFYNAEVGISVTIRIRAINTLNVKGAFTSTTFTVNGDVAAPGVATSVTAAAGYRYNTVSWTNPTDKDLARVDVYAGNTSGSGSATLIGSISGDTFVEGGLNESQTRYYYLKTVDFSGNESAFSAGASVTTLADPTDGATGTRSASGYVYYAFATSSAPSSPTLSGFNFVTGQFSTISSGWSTAVSVPTPQEGTSFWAVRYAVSESTFGGSQTITKSAVFEWQNFDGLVTFTNIQDGIEDNVTSIDGGKISTTSLSAINADLGTITAGVINTAGGATKLSLGSDGAANSALYVTRTSTVGGDGVMVYLDDSTSNSGYYRVFFNSDNGDTMRVDGNGSGSYVSQVASESSGNSIGIGFDVRGYSGTTAQFIQRRNVGSATARNPALRTLNTSSSAEAKFSTGDGYAAYVVSGTIGPFTASHDSVTPKSLSFDAGDIVIDNGVVGKRGVSDVICYGDKSSSANQAGAIGVFVSRRELTEDNPPAALIDHTESVMNPEGEEVTQVHIAISEVTTIKETHDISIVNSIGEGQINVCGEGGDIQIGDLIVTSSMAGKGMKQGDDIIRSYTVAKAREGATFSAGEVKQIACIYLCG
jgi:hypothetical protein